MNPSDHSETAKFVPQAFLEVPEHVTPPLPAPFHRPEGVLDGHAEPAAVAVGVEG